MVLDLLCLIVGVLQGSILDFFSTQLILLVVSSRLKVLNTSYLKTTLSVLQLSYKSSWSS
jgi:hypothetical protein